MLTATSFMSETDRNVKEMCQKREIEVTDSACYNAIIQQLYSIGVIDGMYRKTTPQYLLRVMNADENIKVLLNNTVWNGVAMETIDEGVCLVFAEANHHSRFSELAVKVVAEECGKMKQWDPNSILMRARRCNIRIKNLMTLSPLYKDIGCNVSLLYIPPDQSCAFILGRVIGCRGKDVAYHLYQFFPYNENELYHTLVELKPNDRFFVGSSVFTKQDAKAFLQNDGERKKYIPNCPAAYAVISI